MIHGNAFDNYIQNFYVDSYMVLAYFFKDFSDFCRKFGRKFLSDIHMKVTEYFPENCPRFYQNLQEDFSKDSSENFTKVCFQRFAQKLEHWETFSQRFPKMSPIICLKTTGVITVVFCLRMTSEDLPKSSPRIQQNILFEDCSKISLVNTMKSLLKTSARISSSNFSKDYFRIKLPDITWNF